MIRSELRLPTSLTCRELLTAATTAALHIISSHRDSMRALLGRCMISDARFANHTPMLRCTVRWRIFGNSHLTGIRKGSPSSSPKHCLRSDMFTPEKRIAEWPSMQRLASPVKSEMVLVPR